MNQRNSTFRAVCFRKISFDLNITAAIQIVTKKPVSPCKKVKHHYFEKKKKREKNVCMQKNLIMVLNGITYHISAGNLLAILKT